MHVFFFLVTLYDTLSTNWFQLISSKSRDINGFIFYLCLSQNIIIILRGIKSKLSLRSKTKPMMTLEYLVELLEEFSRFMGVLPMGSVNLIFLSYHYRVDKSTIFGMRGLLRANQMASVLIFCYSKGISISHVDTPCLIKPDSYRIITLEPFVSQRIWCCTVYVSHLGFLSPESI